MPTDKKFPLATTVRSPSPPRIERDAPSGLNTGLPSSALLEGTATQAIERAEAPAWDPRKPSRPPRTEPEALAWLAERSRLPPTATPKDDHRDDPPAPEPDGPYSHGRYGVLESDNQDKPYIEREPTIADERYWQEAMEAAERRR